MGAGHSRSSSREARPQVPGGDTTFPGPHGRGINGLGRPSGAVRLGDSLASNYNQQFHQQPPPYYNANGLNIPSNSSGVQFYGQMNHNEHNRRNATSGNAPMLTKTVKNDVNLKKTSLSVKKDPQNPGHLLVAFDFDTAAPCSVSVFFNVDEIATKLTPKSSTTPPPRRVHFPKQLGQHFELDSGCGLNVASIPEAQLRFVDKQHYPLVVRLETIRKDEADTPTYLPEPPGCKMTEWIQSQTTYAEISKMETGEYTARVVKQKIWVVDTCYELQEIYGIDGGGNDGGGLTAEGHPVNDDSGKECVICLSEPRDTAVLPCRHMCMCSACAHMLRHQTNRCPICRTIATDYLNIKVQSQEDKHVQASHTC